MERWAESGNGCSHVDSRTEFVCLCARTRQDPEAIQRSDRIRAKNKLDRFIRGNPVFANPAYQQADQWGLTDDELMKFMEIYAIGQIQFKRAVDSQPACSSFIPKVQY